MDALLVDMEERASSSPEDLFQQLAALSGGPLVTDSVRCYARGAKAGREPFPASALFREQDCRSFQAALGISG